MVIIAIQIPVVAAHRILRIITQIRLLQPGTCWSKAFYTALMEVQVEKIKKK
jgi:hypothetical protein